MKSVPNYGKKPVLPQKMRKTHEKEGRAAESRKMEAIILFACRHSPAIGCSGHPPQKNWQTNGGSRKKKASRKFTDRKFTDGEREELRRREGLSSRGVWCAGWKWYGLQRAIILAGLPAILFWTF